MKARVLQLVDDLSLGQADASQADFFYDQVLFALNQVALFTTATLLPVTQGTGLYTLPTSAVKRLLVFWDTQQLDELTIEEAEAVFGPTWRDLTGSPDAYVIEREADRTFRLVPTPDTTSKDFIFMRGLPFGLDFPEYSLAVVHTNFQVDVNVLFDFPLAFAVLAKEFARESKHRDTAFAEACGALSRFMLTLITEDIHVATT